MSAPRRRRRDSGFTLVELLIAMVLSVVIVGVVVTAFLVTLKSSAQTRTELGESHDTQLVAAYLPADLLSAGGATSDVDSTPSTATGCAGSPGGNYNVVRLRWSDTFGVSPTYFSTAYRVVNASGEWQLIRYACQAATSGGLAAATASSLVVAHNLKPVVTSADLPTVALSGDQVSLTITDATGYRYVIVGARRTPLVGASASATPSPTPSPTPLQAAVQSISLKNRDHQGYVDLVVTFSRALESACASQFTVTDSSPANRATTSTANLSSGNTVATLALPTSDLTKADTSPAGLAVAFGGTGACTAAGFPSSTSITDAAGPVITQVSSTNGGATAGKMEALDTLTVSVSESLAVYPSVTKVTETDPTGAGNDFLTLTSAQSLFATTNLGSDVYVSGNKNTASFAATTAHTAKTITITLTGSCTGDCSSLVASSGPFSFTQADGLTDTASPSNSLPSTSVPALMNRNLASLVVF